MKVSVISSLLLALLRATHIAGFSAVKQGSNISFGDPKTAVLLPDYASNDPDPTGGVRATVSDTMASLVHIATRSSDDVHQGTINSVLPASPPEVYPPAVAHLKRTGKATQYGENKLGDKKVAVLLPDWASNYPVPNGGKRTFQPSLMKD